MKLHSFSTVLLFFAYVSAHAQELKFPNMKPLELKPKFTLEYWGKLELSGIVKSRSAENVFWIHNDSGDQPRLFAIDSTGQFYRSDRYKNYEGISIAAATNVDWEDITVDSSGNIIVADIGNNGNDRKDLLLYVVPEPSPIAQQYNVLKKDIFEISRSEIFSRSIRFEL